MSYALGVAGARNCVLSISGFVFLPMCVPRSFYWLISEHRWYYYIILCNLYVTPLNYKIRNFYLLLSIYLALHTMININRQYIIFLQINNIRKLCTLCSEFFSKWSRFLLNLWYLEASPLFTENIKDLRVILWCHSAWSKTNQSWQTADVILTKSISTLWDLYHWVCVWCLDNHQSCLALFLCFMV